MQLPSLKRRFMMKHMPDVLAATSPEERDSRRQQAWQTAAERGEPLPSLALAFCRQYGEVATDTDILTHFFGIGRERLFHSEALLTDTDITPMTTLDDLLTTKARKTALWLPEEARPDTAAFIAEERHLYNLWLMNWQPGTDQAQRLIVSSLRHALHRLIETIAYEHLKGMIPGLAQASGALPWSEAPSEQGTAQLNAILPHLADLIEEHVTQLAAAQEAPGRVIIGDGGSPLAPDTPQCEYIVTDPDAHARIRLRHLERDLLTDVLTTPYPVWEADIRRQASARIREQLTELVAAARVEPPSNVTHLDDYRAVLKAAAT